jgi:hypothetical protein
MTKLSAEWNDLEIVRRLISKTENDFDKNFRWQNCFLDNSNEKYRISNKQQLQTNPELFMKAFVIGYAFERQGFNSTIICKKEDCPNRGEKLTAHTIATLRSLRKIQGSRSLDDLFKEDVTDAWLKEFEKSYKEMKSEGEFNRRIEGSLRGFQQFYRCQKAEELFLAIEQRDLKKSFEILTASVRGMGIGPKIAKLIIRDLLLLFEIETKDLECLNLAIPVDIWVRRIFLSLPSFFQQFKNSLRPHNLNNTDDFISDIVVEKCQEGQINPLLFDFGAYFFGSRQLEKRLKTLSENSEEYFQRIYTTLLNELACSDGKC